MSSTISYIRADEMFGSSVSGAVDPTYTNTWLVDGDPHQPVRLTGSGGAWTITGTAQDVNMLVVGHHLLDAGLSVAITGDITDTVVIPAYGANGIPVNAYKAINTVSGVDSLTVTITGNTGTAVIIGEFIAGNARTLPGTLNKATGFGRNNFSTPRPIDRAFRRPYDKGQVAETWSGQMLLTAAQRLDLLAWEESQRSLTRPSVVIVNSTALCGFLEVGAQVAVGQLFKITIRFTELPRTRW